MVGHAQCLSDQPPQVPMAQAVDHPTPFFATGHQTRQPQSGQVLADRGPRRTAGLGQRRHIGRTLAQAPQQRQTGAIGEQTQHLHGRRQPLAIIRLLRSVCS